MVHDGARVASTAAQVQASNILLCSGYLSGKYHGLAGAEGATDTRVNGTAWRDMQVRPQGRAEAGCARHTLAAGADS